MFICNDCGEVFEEPKIYYEHHPYGMGYAEEKWLACPHCGDTDIKDAVECSRCGDYIAEDDAHMDENGLYLCDMCNDELYLEED